MQSWAWILLALALVALITLACWFIGLTLASSLALAMIISVIILLLTVQLELGELYVSAWDLLIQLLFGFIVLYLALYVTYKAVLDKRTVSST